MQGRWSGTICCVCRTQAALPGAEAGSRFRASSTKALHRRSLPCAAMRAALDCAPAPPLRYRSAVPVLYFEYIYPFP
eukprot:6175446-Pleurochrysis_carterae.AAC.1